MFYRTLSIVGLATVLAAGCRNSNNQLPVDLSTAGDMATGGDMAKNYKASDIKTMRQGSSGDFVLANVIAIGVTPSTGSPRIIVQDAAGGDFSGIQGRCSSTSMVHPCSVASTVHTAAIGDNVTLMGTYEKSATSGFETFYIDMITINSHGAALPAVQTVALADVQRGATKAKWYWQHVTVSAPGTLTMYDFTAAEFVRGNNPTACPYQFGFGLLPGTAASTNVCAGATSQPPGVGTPDPNEVLIGTDFYMTWNVSSDCRCTATYHDREPAANSSTTALGGILMFDSVFGSTPPKTYTFLSPLNDADLTLSNLTQR